MSLKPGSRLGVYEVLAPLGAGGMGEVFRARDARLGRDVAIKALPANFAADPERLARFEREARLLASLTHANVAGIFGIEDVGGNRYLILEYVEGETLQNRIDRGPLSVDESLQVAAQIAAALEAAHEAGIVHRDLKPGNVMLTPSGDVKVLDFGLAKSGTGSASSSDVDLTHSPTLTHQVTGAGVILGTAAYMSPEQARGRAVDKRTDIWSFGCVLYECLTGRQSFAGDTVSDLIARILEREPDWDALPARTPSRVRSLLRRCLEKDVKRRLRDIGDARIEIEDIMATKSSSPEMVSAARPSPRVSMRVLLGALALVAVTAVATHFVDDAVQPVTVPAPVRFAVHPNPGGFVDVDGVHVAISPDGRNIAYRAADSTGVMAIWVRSLGSLSARKIPGTEGGNMPFWSPDSRYLGVQKMSNPPRLLKVSLDGKQPEELAEITGPRGASWGSAGVILYTPVSEGIIYRVSERGGDGVPVTRLDSTETAHRYPNFLPDGKHFVYVALPPVDGRYNLYLASLDGGERKLLTDAAGGSAVYAEPGYLIYQRGEVIVAHRFDTRRMELVGDPVSLRERPMGTSFSGGATASVSRDGTLVYTTNVAYRTHLVWTDMQGRLLSTIPMVPDEYINVSLSPDGNSALLERSPRMGISDLWIADLERGVISRLSYEEGENSSACWSRDGKRVAYAHNTQGSPPCIVVVDVTEAGSKRTFLDDNPSFKWVYNWTPDNQALIIGIQNSESRRDIYILPLNGDSTLKPYLTTPFYEDNAKVSPDGRWAVYRSGESDQIDVYVQSFPAPGGKYQVTTGGGEVGGWLDGGKRLAWARTGDPNVKVADVLPGTAFRLGPDRTWFRMPENFVDFDVAGDRQQILVLRDAGPTPPQTITVVQHWQSLLNQE